MFLLQVLHIFGILLFQFHQFQLKINMNLNFYAYGTGGHLTQCHHVGEFARGHPAIVCHYLGLYHGEHGVASAKAQKANLEECYEEEQEYHVL